MVRKKKLTKEQRELLEKIPIKEKKRAVAHEDFYSLPQKYKGIAYPRINMGNYIIVAYLYAREKKYFAFKNFRNAGAVYVNGIKIGLTKLKESLEMSEEYDVHIRDKISGNEVGTIGGKRPYTKFGKFLFKSWDWVEKMDVDRFIILYYPNQEEKQRAAKRYFGDKDASVCDGLDYDFIRVDR